MTLGEKIHKLRKQQGLSQEAFAEKIAVTRQTISKWELDQSTPDLEFIAQISNIFNVSVDYLIKEELVEPDEIPLKKREFHFSEKAKHISLVIISVAALAAVCVCMICDYFTAENLLWSLIVVVSIAAAWFMILPCLTAKKNIVLKTLLIASIVPFPLLAVLALLLKLSIIFTLGACVSFVAIAAVWGIYIILCKCGNCLWRGCGFSLLVLIPVSIAITHIVACFIPNNNSDFSSDIFNSGITLVLSIVCFGIDYLLCHREEDKK